MSRGPPSVCNLTCIRFITIILRGDIIMKKFRLKNLTTFLVALFATAVLVGSFTHYSSKALALDPCEGEPMDCSQPCEFQGWEIKQSTPAQDKTCPDTKTRKAVTGYCGEYWEYTILRDGQPSCEEFICDSNYSRTTGNCIQSAK